MTLPILENFILETPLYEKFDVSVTDDERIYDILYFDGKIDCYCPQCDKQSTFRGIQIKSYTFSSLKRLNPEIYYSWTNRIHPINFVCTRVENHLMQISVYLLMNKFFKIGQHPSLADISMPLLRKYRAVLSPEKYKELNRGIGLITHGVGVGAFVYLRRIFEDLIEEEHRKIIGSGGWEEDHFQHARMDEKIELLRTSLPTFLVEERKLYSILSKGIHQLTEDECLEYFPTVKLGVELILDEKLETKKRNDKIALAKKSIGKIHSDLAPVQSRKD